MGHTLPGGPEPDPHSRADRHAARPRRSWRRAGIFMGRRPSRASTSRNLPPRSGCRCSSARLAGERGLLGRKLDELKAAGGRVLLLDEIEKAHRTVSDLLLGMEAAEITLANGETIDLSGFHIIATSNLGSADAIEMDEVARASVRRHIEQEAASHFRPEVYARFTAVIVFHRLTREAQLQICQRILDEETPPQSTGPRAPVRCMITRCASGRASSDGFSREGYHRNWGRGRCATSSRGESDRALVAAQLRGPWRAASGNRCSCPPIAPASGPCSFAPRSSACNHGQCFQRPRAP